MGCDDARFYLRFRRSGPLGVRPDDLGPEVAADLDRHLAGCPVCAAEAGAVARFDAAVGRAMRDVPVPAGLRSTLIADLYARRGAVHRRRAYRYAAAAASVLLATGITLGVFSAARPTIDTRALVQAVDDRADPRLAEEAVRQWLTAEGLPGLPEPFDFSLYVCHAKLPVQGRDVPAVVFRDRQGVESAAVYFFRDADFKRKDVEGALASRGQAVVRPWDRATGVTMVVVYTGGSLAPFLRGGAGGGEAG